MTIRILGAGAVLVVGAALAYLAFTAVNGPLGVPLTSPTPNRGQAATQFASVGFTVQVTGIARASGLVRLQVVFRNTSAVQQRADPRDFSLAGRGPVFGAGCREWGRVDLYPRGGAADQPLRDPEGTRAGAVFGPAALCLPDPGAGALTLVWEPDVAFGPLSEPIRIPLR